MMKHGIYLIACIALWSRTGLCAGEVVPGNDQDCQFSGIGTSMDVPAKALGADMVVTEDVAAASDHSQTPRPEELARADREFHRAAMEQARKNGVPPEGIVAREANYQFDLSGMKIGSWTDWTNHFKAVLLNPPVLFKKREKFPYDFSNPISAFRSYRHAFFIGDASTLLKYADESGRRRLNSLGVTNPGQFVHCDLTNALTEVTILLTASANYDGNDYVLVFWRGQNEVAPKNGAIALQKTIFVKTDGNYLLTQDMSESYLGQILEVSHAAGGIWKYSKGLEYLKKSQLPSYFYDLH